jgi:hypothetical protein
MISRRVRLEDKLMSSIRIKRVCLVDRDNKHWMVERWVARGINPNDFNWNMCIVS